MKQSATINDLMPRRLTYSKKGSRMAVRRSVARRSSRCGSVTERDNTTPIDIKPAVIQNTSGQGRLSASISDKEPGMRLEIR